MIQRHRNPQLYPPVAPSVRVFRKVGAWNIPLVAITSVVTFIMGTLSYESRVVPGWFVFLFSTVGFCSFAFLAKTSWKDENLDKNREEPLPWRWWILPATILVSSFFGVSFYMLYVVG